MLPCWYPWAFGDLGTSFWKGNRICLKNFFFDNRIVNIFLEAVNQKPFLDLQETWHDCAWPRQEFFLTLKTVKTMLSFNHVIKTVIFAGTFKKPILYQTSQLIRWTGSVGSSPNLAWEYLKRVIITWRFKIFEFYSGPNQGVKK